jgi:hypothetical protein
LAKVFRFLRWNGRGQEFAARGDNHGAALPDAQARQGKGWVKRLCLEKGTAKKTTNSVDFRALGIRT